MKLSLTAEQQEDLLLIAGFEITVPQAIVRKRKAYGYPKLSAERVERLTDSLTAIWQKLEAKQ